MHGQATCYSEKKKKFQWEMKIEKSRSGWAIVEALNIASKCLLYIQSWLAL